MESKHIVIFPFMAQGHLIPFLALASLIEQRKPNYTITLVNTPLNIKNLHSALPPNSKIQLRDLPFSSSDHGLPPNSENTDSLPHHHIIRLFQASHTLRPHFELLLADIIRNEGRNPFCIIADVFFGWTVEVAKKFGIFHTTFTTCGAYGTAAYISLWLNLPHTRTASSEFNIPGFPETFRLHRSQLSHYMRAAHGEDPWSIFFQKQISLSLESNAMLCNTVEEVELIGIRLLRSNTGLRVWTIGPLLPLDANSSTRRAGKKPGIDVKACIEWLDSNPPASVIYISFGSQNTISASQMMELALGLEASGQAFIWVIRPPFGFDLSENFREEWLPEGFEERTRERKQGILVKNWAPQLEILSHESTGVFLSHCGWNSVLESLSRGVPVIGWPLASEQFYNSKMLEEELGVSVELARGVESSVEHGEVERVIRLVMSERKGEEMKQKAVGYAEMIRAAMREEGDDQKGSSLRALDKFIETVLKETGEMKRNPSLGSEG